MDIFINNLFQNPVYFFSVVILVGFSVCLHEFFHAAAALRCGDPTAARAGHLTLNPLKQMGMTSLLMLLFFGLCWGAVPVNYNYLNTKSKQIITSLAGPFANFLLFLFFGVVATLISSNAEAEIMQFFLLGAVYNMALLILNLLPIPGLDGGAVVQSLFPWWNWTRSEAAKAVLLIMILLIFSFSRYLFLAAGFLTVVYTGVLGALFGATGA